MHSNVNQHSPPNNKTIEIQKKNQSCLEKEVIVAQFDVRQELQVQVRADCGGHGGGPGEGDAP